MKKLNKNIFNKFVIYKKFLKINKLVKYKLYFLFIINSIL